MPSPTDPGQVHIVTPSLSARSSEAITTFCAALGMLSRQAAYLGDALAGGYGAAPEVA
jgi:hypothetical protein